jgi:hypothetical protein
MGAECAEIANLCSYFWIMFVFLLDFFLTILKTVSVFRDNLLSLKCHNFQNDEAFF